jgi:NAD(P)H dehydrogenase (quinone)
VTIAVTGATGYLGSAVTRLLAESGVEQRLVVRDPSRAPRLPGVTTAVATYEDTDAMARALDGVRTMFLVSGHEHPDRIRIHRSAVEGARRAGVERVVYTSFMGAAPQASFPYARDHAATELAIRDAGMALTAMRNALYADMAPLFVGDDGVIRAPAADGRVAWVARRDVARLAVVLLTGDGHEHQVYDVSGPVAIDLHETARLLAEVTGRPIRYRPETLEEARASRAGHRDWLVDGWIGSYLALHTGEGSVTSHTVERLTGTPPMGFAEYLAGEPSSWAHLSG